MGYVQATARISASLSRHNSEKDVRHDDLWKDFVEKMQMLANNKKYAEINIDIDADVDP